jgi:hypothetical protein
MLICSKRHLSLCVLGKLVAVAHSTLPSGINSHALPVLRHGGLPSVVPRRLASASAAFDVAYSSSGAYSFGG